MLRQIWIQTVWQRIFRKSLFRTTSANEEKAWKNTLTGNKFSNFDYNKINSMSHVIRIKFDIFQLQIRGEFNNASALECSLYWCQALHITNKDRYQNNERSQALTSLNSPQLTHQHKLLCNSLPILYSLTFVSFENYLKLSVFCHKLQI